MTLYLPALNQLPIAMLGQTLLGVVFILAVLFVTIWIVGRVTLGE
jgi:hypothetical protein